MSRRTPPALGRRDRGAQYNLRIDAGWSDPALDTAIGWARSSWSAMALFATGGVYIDFAGIDRRRRPSGGRSSAGSGCTRHSLLRAYLGD
ncbi:MAG: hypothetical protein M3R63_06960 [Actinomycetota bacterium]|nr:hypothetical protein [Actinomycetota bacterium]